MEESHGRDAFPLRTPVGFRQRGFGHWEWRYGLVLGHWTGSVESALARRRSRLIPYVDGHSVGIQTSNSVGSSDNF